ncbi:MAG TPA: sugar phosphate isomerase/epimerase [Verrucomicrobiota bacterium]|nr:sugar phosphate isomerase/epimerase [Verrucomicrobiota bacterium]HNU50478.1 sugar phosphate isomerase/epimerase [Verrucomicrobiota bacterium]
MNNPIWLMTSALKALDFDGLVRTTAAVGAQGLELCVFRRDGTRRDHVATHLDYETFGPETARHLIDRCRAANIRFSVGAYENLIGGDPQERVANQNHLLRLIRIAHLCGGDRNQVAVGTFVGYNHDLGTLDRGFERNLDEYTRVFAPIIRYAEDLGVTVLYENCPMEGWRPATSPTTYNNLPGCLAARKLMYALIPSRAHGETYDPSHDVWQNINPSDVILASDMNRIHRVHIKGTRNRAGAGRTHWGALYPMQAVRPDLAQHAGVPIPAHEWDRHHYEPMLPGFGGNDSMDWRAFLETLMQRGFNNPFVIENEADNSAHTGNLGATVQGFKAAVLCLAPIVWPLVPNEGYCCDTAQFPVLVDPPSRDVPLKTMADL